MRNASTRNEYPHNVAELLDTYIHPLPPAINFSTAYAVVILWIHDLYCKAKRVHQGDIIGCRTCHPPTRAKWTGDKFRPAAIDEYRYSYRNMGGEYIFPF